RHAQGAGDGGGRLFQLLFRHIDWEVCYARNGDVRIRVRIGDDQSIRNIVCAFLANDDLDGNIIVARLHGCYFLELREFLESSAVRKLYTIDRGGVALCIQCIEHVKQTRILDASDGTVKDDVESAGAVKTNGTASKPLFLTGVLFDSIVRVFDGFLSTNSTLGVLLYRNVHLRRCRTLGKRNTGSNANGIGIIARGNKA